MGEIASLKIGIGASVEGFKSGLADVKNSLGGLGTFASKALTLLSNPIALATTAIVGIGAAAFSVGKDFDAAFDTIRIGTGATGENLEGLKEDFRGVFGSVPDDAATVGTAIADLNTRLGLTGQPLEDMTRQFLDLARITGGDVSTQIANVTRVFGDWGVATEDQSGAMDFLFKTSQTTGIGVDKLANTIVQFGAPLRQLGFDFESSAVLIGKWEKEGVNVETVLAGMKMGLSNFAEAGIPAEQALQGVIAEIKAFGPGAEASAAAAVAFGKRAGPDMAAAILEGRFELDEIMATIQASPETIGAAAEDVKSFGERWSELTNKVSLLLEPLGTLLFDALTTVATFLVDSFNPAMEFLGELWDGLLSFISPVTEYFKNNVLPVLQTVGEVWLGLQLMLADLFIPVITAVWNALQPLVSFIADQVIFQIKAFFQNIQNLIGLLSKIPGVSDLFTAAQERLTEAMGGSAEEQERAALAAQFLGTEEKKAAKEADKLAKAQEASRAKAEEQTKQISALNNETRLLTGLLEQATESEKKSIQTQIDANNKKAQAILNADAYGKSLGGVTAAINQASPAAAGLAVNLKKTTDEAQKLEDAFQKELGAAVKELRTDFQKTLDTMDAYDSMMLTVSEGFRKGIVPLERYRGALEIYDQKIASLSGKIEILATQRLQQWAVANKELQPVILATASDTQMAIDQAVVFAEVLRVDLPEGATAANAAMSESLAAMNSDTQQQLPVIAGVFTTWAEGVRSIVGSLSTGLTTKLFTDPGSFGAEALGKLKTIGTSFLEVFDTKMFGPGGIITGFINKGINVLMGALDGLISKITVGLGGALSNVFGAGANAATNAAGTVANTAETVGTTATSGASQAGGLLGAAAGGPLAWAGLAVGIADAVIGGMQRAKMNDRLFQIAESTLGIKNILGGDAQDSGVIHVLWRLLEQIEFGVGTKKIEDLSNRFALDFMPWTERLAAQGASIQPTLDHFGADYFGPWGGKFDAIERNTADTVLAVRELQGRVATQGADLETLKTAVENNDGGITTTLGKFVRAR
jgi:hypothetical protein